MRALVLQHALENPPAVWADALELRGVEVDVVRVDLDGLPGDHSAYDLVVAMGGPQSLCAAEQPGWLREEIEAIGVAVRRGTPFLGICLGAQLLARALGAQCRVGSRPEVGIIPVRTTPAGRNDPVLGPLGPRFPALAFHGDTLSLPPDAVRLARSTSYANQAFRWGDVAYGLQFHLEPSATEFAAWLELPCAAAALRPLGRAGRAALLAQHERLEACLNDIALGIAWRWYAAAQAARRPRASRRRPAIVLR